LARTNVRGYEVLKKPHIAEDNPDAAERVRAAILDAADLLAANPGIGRGIRNAKARRADIRWLVVPKFRNYLIFYRPFDSNALSM
jgi:plasmid stabilization system protein ParE